MSINHPCSSFWLNRRGEVPFKSSIFFLSLTCTVFLTNTRVIFKRFSYNSCQDAQSIRSKVHILHFTPIQYDLDHFFLSLTLRVLGDRFLASWENVSVCVCVISLLQAVGCVPLPLRLIFTSQSIWQFWVHEAFTLVPRGTELNSHRRTPRPLFLLDLNELYIRLRL